ncbi:Tetratricopeptide repeat-containing protein [Desulfatibacillum alkenivorans DSM 16219]|uniref:Tetratricopeptide repeat-containing protein n=2 Tax=Desulfatibacillum alkenivorans TaxID=259354 RepID=A0A1M6V2J8_9BACT|nr:Tetratricopeptide repeat-containing protein [Desulfatibacillum alkenivorans DSM 16219]
MPLRKYLAGLMRRKTQGRCNCRYMQNFKLKIGCLLILAFFALASSVLAQGQVRKVEARLVDGKTQMLVSLSDPSSYTVIRLSKNEVLLAFQNSSLAPGANKPFWAKDSLIKDLSVSQKRQDVVSILALLKEPAVTLDYSLDQAKTRLTLEMAGSSPAPSAPKPAAAPAPPAVQPPAAPLTSTGGTVIASGRYDIEGKPTIIRPESAPKPEPTPEPVKVEETPPPVVKPPGDSRYPIKRPLNPATAGHDFSYDGPLLSEADGSGTPDQDLFSKAVEEYKTGQWQDAIRDFSILEQSYPLSEKIEPAAFLTARAYHGLYGANLTKRFVDVAEKYRRAVKQFPNSRFAPQAIVYLVQMYKKVGNYPEAAAYADLVWDRYKDRAISPDFMLLRGQALLANGQKEQALGVFDMLLGYYPDSEFVEAALLEKAKVLHEERAYKKSLEMLQDIEKKDPQARFVYPDLARYMGENYYQLKANPKARELFFQTVNTFPDTPDKDILYTKIGDSFKGQGMPDKAAMIYKMVISNFPGSDGRLISLVRLADYIEENPDSDIMEDKRPKDIHQEIVRNNPDHPLAQVSMIKLARLAHDEKRYEDSVSILLGLLARHPFTKLHDDVREALLASLEAIFTRDHRDKDFAHIVEYYDKVRDVVPFEEMPQLMFIVANAYRETGMCSWALTQLEKVSRFYDDPKPADIMFIMADCNKKVGEIENARRLFETFVLQYPNEPRFVEAYYQLADIYLERGETDPAIQALRVCLRPGTPYSGDFNLMFQYAKLLKNKGEYQDAAEAFNKAVDLVMKSDPPNTQAAVDIQEGIGDLYEEMELTSKAVTHFEQALKLSGGPNSYPALEFKLARCYASLGEAARATEILESLAQSGENIWAKAAKAKLEQVQVKGAWDKTG